MKNPNHIAIIMDGNGRWGKKNLKNRILGHRAGIENIKKFIIFFLKNKIKNLTLYALSADNFKKRNIAEINNLFNLLIIYLGENKEIFKKNKINLHFIGEKKKLPLKIKKIIKKTSYEFNFKKENLNLNVALNYSGREEIIKTIKKLHNQNKKINVKNIEQNLYTSHSRNPEILIRTGGYQRLSDFLIWQLNYTEIFFVKKLWPDFRVIDLKNILKKFKNINRKFGA